MNCYMIGQEIVDYVRTADSANTSNSWIETYNNILRRLYAHGLPPSLVEFTEKLSPTAIADVFQTITKRWFENQPLNIASLIEGKLKANQGKPSKLKTATVKQQVEPGTWTYTINSW